MFSSRVPRDLEPNRLAHAIRRARRDGRRLIDLTVSNPTAAGVPYPADVLEPLANPASRVYEPDARGLDRARAAVADDYARRGISVAKDQLVLTASTSEAYSVLFKLLCEPSGDAVLTPAPSYPLFDHLTRLDGVGLVPYRLEYHGRWVLDERSVEEAWTDRVRAALAVSPNNPTGSVLRNAELAWLHAFAAERHAAVIVDEVFADYPLDEPAEAGPPTTHAGAHRTSGETSVPPPGLIFRLGGLSKSAGLPQVKLGWIAVDGPRHLTDAALERLDFICDAYLSVGTPVQAAAADLIARGAAVRAGILARIRGNIRVLRDVVAAEPSIELLHADAGWTAVLRVPSTRAEEELALELLERDGVIVHPGYFFDFAHEAFLVVSLLPEPDAFADGVRRIVERARG